MFILHTFFSNGVSTSALCRYRLDHIHELFQTSKFKSPANAKSLWLPVDPDSEPDPRPGFDVSSIVCFFQNFQTLFFREILKFVFNMKICIQMRTNKLSIC